MPIRAGPLEPRGDQARNFRRFATDIASMDATSSSRGSRPSFCFKAGGTGRDAVGATVRATHFFSGLRDETAA
jgi:hypothetical protein